MVSVNITDSNGKEYCFFLSPISIGLNNLVMFHITVIITRLLSNRFTDVNPLCSTSWNPLVIIVIFENDWDDEEETFDKSVNPGGSLGYLAAKVCKEIAPILDSVSVDCIATVTSATPLSKHSKRCKNALLSICINFDSKKL